MILHEVVERLCNTYKNNEKARAVTTDPDFSPARMLDKPNYYVVGSRLISMAKDIDKDNTVLNYRDISLPHDELIITIVDDTKNTISEALFNIGDMGDKLQVLCYFNFPEFPRLEHIHMNLHIAEPKDGSGNGADCTIEHDNLGAMLHGEEKTRAEQQLTQYAYNAISQFNLVINKNKDLREGKEKRTMKVFRGKKGKKAYRDVTFIHLNSHKTLLKNNYTTKDNVTWSNSWVVRGHWRYFSKVLNIGKNRRGEYRETGRTWVVPHEKQTHLEKSNRLRILK